MSRLGAAPEGGSLVVFGPLTRECRTVLAVLLTVLNNALSLVLDGYVVPCRGSSVYDCVPLGTVCRLGQCP
ncbi:MAG: hypothetical protein RQ842_08000 [Vulcanisaeta sp.]|nr:hypothetical protein [Vulcanisaeta sp.]